MGSACFSSQFQDNETLSRIQGKHIKGWIKDINNFVKMIEESIECDDNNPEMRDFVKACKVWTKITKFINIAKVPDDKVDAYKTELEDFNKNVVAFCKCGGTTFMKGDQMGDNETFYLHVVRNYLPEIAKNVLENCQFGLGVFTMQGFEHRNKQSKRTFKLKTNSTGNIVLQSMKALCSLFKFSIKL